MCIRDRDNSECNVCFKVYKKLNKCDICSFMICDICISKLDNIALSTAKIQYKCCVCNELNFLKIKDITNINVMKNIYEKQIDLQDETDEEIIVITNIILIYNAPVISNNKVSYFGSNIIALKTQYNNEFTTIDLHYKIDPLRALYNLNYFSYIPQVDYNFIYSSNEYDFTLLPNKDFYELINNKTLEFS